MKNDGHTKYNIYEGAIRKAFSLKEHILSHKGFNPLKDKNWKNLIVLDACRYDTFLDHNTIKGFLSKKISNASDTLEWAKKNLKHKYSNTILISSNPQLSKINLKDKIGFNPFKHIEPVWDYGWDKYVKTVFPNEVIESTIRLRDKYLSERFIIWFMQPHHPFIGHSLISEHDGIVWEQIKSKKLSISMAYRAYEDNLNMVLTKVKDGLLPYLDGKTVITTDHGNCFGEHGLLAHPHGIYVKELVEVPWLEVIK